MRLELENRVDCTDGSFGKLVDVVIDPVSRRVTHLVVEQDREAWPARLVPVELAERGGDASGALALRATAEEVRRLPPVHEVAYLRLDGFPVDDPDWDIGIEEVLGLPYYPSYDLEPQPVDFAARYDRVPKGEVEIRRTSVVESADGHHLGDVDGFLVDDDQLITHVVLEQGHPWERREVLVPIGAVSRVESDSVTLSLMKAEVDALPPVSIRRWLEPGNRGRSDGQSRRRGGPPMPPPPLKPFDKAAIVQHLHRLGRHHTAGRADAELENRLYTAQDAMLLARFNIDPAYIEGWTYPDRLDVTRETFRDRPPRED